MAKKTSVNRKEKRRYPRVEQRITCEIQCDDSIWIAEIINLSAGGALCKVDKSPALMTNLKIVLPLVFDAEYRDVEYIECEGAVVRIEPDPDKEGAYQVAVFFHTIEREEQEKIEKYIRKVNAMG